MTTSHTELLPTVGCDKTPMSDHVQRFWRILGTEHVRILVDTYRALDSTHHYWDSSSFSDDVAKALVAERAALSATPQPPAQTVAALGAWPDFKAPQQYENPAEGWADPGLPDFRAIWASARSVGYAVGLHGSMKRDCDLIAVPWTDKAVAADELVEAICKAINAKPLNALQKKPLGRVAVTLNVTETWSKAIDLSITPRLSADLIEELVGWRAMLNAPTDGTRVLLSRIQRNERETFKAVVIGRHTGDFENPKCWVFDGTYARPTDFYGWQPLPPSKARAQTGEKKP